MIARGGSSNVLLAALAAILLLVQQVAGRAIRDAFFLSQFPVASLPNVVLASAAIALTGAFVVTRLFLRLGPARVLPLALGASAGLHLVEWILSRGQPGPAAVLLYIHTATLGIILISGFWSMVSEALDPRTMRRNSARLTGGATVGGLLGALLVDRVGAWGSVASGLLLLALFQIAAGVAVVAFSRGQPHSDASEGSGALSGMRALRDTPLLRHMALLMVLASATATLLDYVVKAEAAGAFSDPGRLLRFFALFHGVVSVGSFMVQLGFARFVLERAGLTASVASLPATVLVASLGALFWPGLWPAAIARGSEAVFRNSLFRSGFEPHFAPISRDRKRASKTLIDVGGERTGDALGGLVVKGVLFAAPAVTRSLLCGLAAVGACLTLYFVGRLRRGYVQALEQNLLEHGGHLELGELPDEAVRESVLQSLSAIQVDPALLRELREQMASGAHASGESETPSDLPAASTVARIVHPSAASPAAAPAAPARADPLLTAIEDFRSGDAGRVRAALLRHGRMDASLVPHVVRLLAWDAVAEKALRSLVRTGPRVAGQLADALLDPEQEFAIRRRVPRALAAMPTPLAARALFEGLRDKRFEVRFQCGRALARHEEAGLALPVTSVELEKVILEEVAVDRRVWESRRLLETPETGDGSLFVDQAVADRANRSLEHVFTLLSLILPRDPLRIAFRGLHAGDPALRGTALEYLESVLPSAVRVSLWPFLEPMGSVHVASDRSREEILARLLESNLSLQINLAEVKDALAQPGRPDPEGEN